MIISGGFNVFPTDVRIVGQHKDVLDVAVIGIHTPNGVKLALHLLFRPRAQALTLNKSKIGQMNDCHGSTS